MNIKEIMFDKRLSFLRNKVKVRIIEVVKKANKHFKEEDIYEISKDKFLQVIDVARTMLIITNKEKDKIKEISKEIF